MAYSVCDMESTLSKLQSMGKEIDDLLRSGLTTNPVLADNIAEALNLVARLPLNDSEWMVAATEWRGKMSNWLKHYLTIVGSKETSACVPYTAEANFSPLTPPMSRSSSFLSLTVVSNDSFVTCPEEHSEEESLKAAILEIFDCFDIKFQDQLVHDQTLSGMTYLLNSIVDSFNLLPPEIENVELQSWAFDLAFGKLSFEMRDHYDFQYGDDDRTLYSLFNFLRYEIFAHRGKRHLNKKLLKSLQFCDRCFESGHVYNYCLNDPLFYWPQITDPKWSKLSLLFGRVCTIKSVQDFGGMDLLLSIIARAFEVVPPNLKNGSLQSRIFEVAFSKMCQQFRESFSSQYLPEDYCLYSLFNFLLLEMNEFIDNFKVFYSKAHMLSLMFGRKSRSFMAAPKRRHYGCEYCQGLGHEITNCPERLELLCHRCFLNGHLAPRCMNEPIFYWN